jgi:hypothetical protein
VAVAIGTAAWGVLFTVYGRGPLALVAGAVLAASVVFLATCLVLRPYCAARRGLEPRQLLGQNQAPCQLGQRASYDRFPGSRGRTTVPSEPYSRARGTQTRIHRSLRAAALP